MSSPTSPPAGRYGGPTSRRSIWVIATLSVVTFFSWVAWVMATDPTYGIEWVAFETTGGETTATMKFQITAPPGTPVTCALRSIDYSMSTNGWDVRSFPASDQFVTQHTATLRGVSEISGVDVFRCWRSGS